MLGKLLKHEFVATGRLMLPAYAAVLVMALVARLTGSLPAQWPEVIATIVFVMMIVATFALTFLLLLQRFYKNMLGNEGYLTMTLPVGVDSLIFSKLIVSVVWIVASSLITVAAAFLLALPMDNFFELIRLGGEASLRTVDTLGVPVIVLVCEIFVVMIAALMGGILQLYASMAIGQLVSRHRALLSVGAFLGFNTVLQILFAVAVTVCASVPALQNGILDALNFLGSTPATAVQSGFLLLFVGYLALAAIFYSLTRYLLRNRLNLA